MTDSQIATEVVRERFSDFVDRTNTAAHDAALHLWWELAGEGWLDLGYGPTGLTSFDLPLAFAEEVGRAGISSPFAICTTSRYIHQVASIGWDDSTLADVPALVFKGSLPMPGESLAVPWARYSGGRGLAVVAPLGIWSFTYEASESRQTTNLAGEPVDWVSVKSTDRVANAIAAVASITYFSSLMSAQLAGLCSGISALVVEHAKQREQFGRPIYKFQAVSQAVARVAARSILCGAAVDTLRGMDHRASEQDEPSFEGAYFKGMSAFGQNAALASAAAAEGHQVLGALGTTQEHSLHRYTTRVWAWRDVPFSADMAVKSLADLVSRTSEEALWRWLTP